MLLQTWHTLKMKSLAYDCGSVKFGPKLKDVLGEIKVLVAHWFCAVASLLGCAASRVFIHTVQRLCSCSCSAVWSCLRDAELSLHRRALSSASLVLGHFFPTEQLVDGIMRIIVTVLPLPLITPFAPNRMPRGHQLSRNAQHPERSIETRDV